MAMGGDGELHTDIQQLSNQTYFSRSLSSGQATRGRWTGGGWERGSQQPNQIHLRPDGQRQPTTIGPCDFVIVQTLTGVGLMSWRCRRADPMKPADRGGWSGGRRGSTGRLEMDGDTHLARQALWRLSWPWLID
jgi:hypothetical protein